MINVIRGRESSTNYAVECAGNHLCGGNLGGTRRADSDDPDARWAYDPAVGRGSGSGAEYKTEKAQTEDGAGGGPAEERTCARGRGVRLLKIGESDAIM